MASEIAKLQSDIARDIDTNQDLEQFMADLDKDALKEALK